MTWFSFYYLANVERVALERDSALDLYLKSQWDIPRRRAGATKGPDYSDDQFPYLDEKRLKEEEYAKLGIKI